MTDLTQSSVVDEETLAEIVGFVWQTFVGDEVLARLPASTPIPAPDRFATIAIGGTWTATIVASMTPGLLRRFAAHLMGLPPSELEPDDVDDAFGELANVVGGNVKGLIDDPATTLSLPLVSETRPVVPGGRHTAHIAYDLGGEAMTWELWERV